MSDPVSVLVDGFIARWVPEQRAVLTAADDNDGERLRRDLRAVVAAAVAEVHAATAREARDCAVVRAWCVEYRSRLVEAEGALRFERARLARVSALVGARGSL